MMKLRLDGSNSESMLTNIVLMVVGGIALTTISLVLVFSDGCSPSTPMRLPQPEYFNNFIEYDEPEPHPPGTFAVEAETDMGPSFKVVKTGEEILAERKKRAPEIEPYQPSSLPAEGEELVSLVRNQMESRGVPITTNPSTRENQEISMLAELEQQPVLTVQPQVKADSWGTSDPNLDLKREFEQAPRRSLPEPWKGTKDDGPYYEPIQEEQSFIAFENLIKDITKLDAQSIASASNGKHFLHAVTPDVINQYRGRVFDAEGVLWSLRKQPLRNGAYTYAGKEYQHAWYGVMAYLREGKVRGERDWVHEALSFTTLTLPEELQKYALEPGELNGNQSALAEGKVFVKLSGVYFRRILYWEPVAELEVVDTTKTEGTLKREYWAEDYMPWLVAPSIEVSEPAWPEGALDKAMLEQNAEDKFDPARRDRFDETGYYVMLRAQSDDSLGYTDIPVEDMIYRKLLTRADRTRWRGARVRVEGFLQGEYFPVILPPNISGRRHIYRTFVLDAKKSTEIDQSQQWYVDVLNPPESFQGRAPVMVEASYYRSQQFNTKDDSGKLILRTYPLLLAREISPREGESASEDSGVNLLALWVTLGVGGVIVVALIFMGRRDRKRRDAFEMQTMSMVRSQLSASRARAAQRKAGKDGEAENAGEDAAADEKSDDSAGEDA